MGIGASFETCSASRLISPCGSPVRDDPDPEDDPKHESDHTPHADLTTSYVPVVCRSCVDRRVLQTSADAAITPTAAKSEPVALSDTVEKTTWQFDGTKYNATK